MAHPLAHSSPSRPHRMPAESIVREDWQSGVTRREMTALYGVSRTAIDNFMRQNLPRWLRDRVKPLAETEGKIVLMRETYVEHAPRRILISLPRISMHVAALEEKTGKTIDLVAIRPMLEQRT